MDVKGKEGIVNGGISEICSNENTALEDRQSWSLKTMDYVQAHWQVHYTVHRKLPSQSGKR